MLDIDTRLADGHWERAETRDVQKTYNLNTVAELRELCPGFDWDVYVRNLSASAHEADELLVETCVRQPSYFEHLSTVLDEVSIDDWRAWLLTHVLRSAAPYLSDDFVEANFDFYGRTLNGTPELRARWKRGVAPGRGRASARRSARSTSRGTSRRRPRRRWTTWSPTCSRPTASRSRGWTG